MNAERLHAIVNAVNEDLETTGSVKLLEQLTGALQNQIGNPAEPSYQKEVADLRQRLIEALRKSPSNLFPPTTRQALEELGVEDLFGAALADTIEEVFNQNQITPTVARDQLVKFHSRLKEFAEIATELRNAFRRLGIGSETLPQGATELGLLIPREFVHNKLDHFAQELAEDNRIFAVFAELATGSRPGFPIQSISSSELSIFLDLLNPKTAACIAVAVAAVIANYKKILEIRKLRRELQDQGLTEPELQSINDHAEGLMEAGIAETVDRLLTDFYKDARDGRKNELKIELTYSMRNIAARIDRGFNIEVRVAPSGQPTEDTDSQNNAGYEQMITDISPTLQFLKREGPPILSLPDPTEEPQESKKDGQKEEPKKDKKEDGKVRGR